MAPDELRQRWGACTKMQALPPLVECKESEDSMCEHGCQLVGLSGRGTLSVEASIRTCEKFEDCSARSLRRHLDICGEGPGPRGDATLVVLVMQTVFDEVGAAILPEGDRGSLLAPPDLLASW